MFPQLHRYPHFALDTEATGLRYKVDTVFGVSISLPDGRDFYWDIRETPQALAWLKVELPRYKGTIIMANASYDARMLWHMGVPVPLRLLDDVIIRGSLIDEHLPSHSLDALGKKYLGQQKETEIWDELAAIHGGLATRNVQIPRIASAPPSLVGKYAMGDSRLTLNLWEWQNREIKRQELEQITAFERKLMPTIIRTEMAGIRVDLDYAERAAEQLTPLLEESQAKLNELAGRDLNTNSPKQIREMFDPRLEPDGEWYTSNGFRVGKTDKGMPSFGAEFLREMNDPRAELILDIRSIIKTRDTFLRGHVLEHAVGDRVYPTINQAQTPAGGTGTGRLSYTGPAMQQIPSRNKKVAAKVKPCFLPDEGEVWVDADEHSFEVRIFAHLVKNEEIINRYKIDPWTDFHDMTSDMTGLVRNAQYSGQPNAKQLNLSMIFNSGNGSIADKMGMPWEWDTFTNKKGKEVTYRRAGPEAMKVINAYHRRLPGIKELATRAKKKAKHFGYLKTEFGRRLRFPRKDKTYKASGMMIQATAADHNKKNWILIAEALDGEGRLILNTHDSYSMSMPKERHVKLYERVQRKLNVRPELRVPLRLEKSGVGDDWWEALSGNKNRQQAASAAIRRKAINEE